MSHTDETNGCGLDLSVKATHKRRHSDNNNEKDNDSEDAQQQQQNGSAHNKEEPPRHKVFKPDEEVLKEETKDDSASTDNNDYNQAFMLTHFSDEILYEIFKHLPTSDLRSLMHSSSRFYSLVLDRRFWMDIDLWAQPLPFVVLADILKKCQRQTKSIQLHGIQSTVKSKIMNFNHALRDALRMDGIELTVLKLKSVTLHFQTLRIIDYPPTLKHLVFADCKALQNDGIKNIFSRIDVSHLELEEIAIEYCDWFEPSSLMMFSKMANLRSLSLKGCSQLRDFVPYASMAARFGFRKLEYLDLSFTPVGDSDLQCFNAVTTLKELKLDYPTYMRESKSSTEVQEMPKRSHPKPKSVADETEPAKKRRLFSYLPDSDSTDGESSRATFNSSSSSSSSSSSGTSTSFSADRDIADSSRSRQVHVIRLGPLIEQFNNQNGVINNKNNNNNDVGTSSSNSGTSSQSAANSDKPGPAPKIRRGEDSPPAYETVKSDRPSTSKSSYRSTSANNNAAQEMPTCSKYVPSPGSNELPKLRTFNIVSRDDKEELRKLNKSLGIDIPDFNGVKAMLKHRERQLRAIQRSSLASSRTLPQGNNPPDLNQGNDPPVQQSNDPSTQAQNNGSPLVQKNDSQAFTQNNDATTEAENNGTPPAQNNVPSAQIQKNDAPTETENSASPPALAQNSDPPTQAENNDAPAQAENNDLPAQAGNNDAPAQAGNNDPPAQDGNNDAPAQAGNNDAPAQAGNNDAPAQAGNNNAPAQAGNGDPPAQAGNVDPPAQVGNNDLPAQAGNNDPLAQARIDNDMRMVENNIIRLIRNNNFLPRQNNNPPGRDPGAEVVFAIRRNFGNMNEVFNVIHQQAEENHNPLRLEQIIANAGRNAAGNDDVDVVNQPQENPPPANQDDEDEGIGNMDVLLDVIEARLDNRGARYPAPGRRGRIFRLLQGGRAMQLQPPPIDMAQREMRAGANFQPPQAQGVQQLVRHPLFWDMLHPLQQGPRGRRGPHIPPGRNLPRFYITDRSNLPRQVPVPYQPITNRSICSFGRPNRQVDQGVIWIRIGNRPANNSFERLSVRNYVGVTDLSLRHLVQCSPNLVFIDLTGTGVTWAGVQNFKAAKPDCEVIADHLAQPNAQNEGNGEDA